MFRRLERDVAGAVAQPSSLQALIRRVQTRGRTVRWQLCLMCPQTDPYASPTVGKRTCGHPSTPSHRLRSVRSISRRMVGSRLLVIGMTRRQAYLALAAGMTVAACAHTTSSSRANNITPSARRLAAIRHAQVWAPTDVASMDLRAGPQGPGAFTRMNSSRASTRTRR
jgi:hypothetical protein